MAFGTGHHATTRLCLTAMLDVLNTDKDERLKTFLDLGTGSGILGIAACMSGLTGIGLDIDPVAVDNARLNAEVNGCGNGLELAEGSLDTLEDGTVYDLVTANILAGPLSDMAPKLAARVAKGGVLILSGILTEQAESVIQAYAKAGLTTPQRHTEGEWTALVYGPVA
jgi:ribosomal protein L11 methyltransferase